MTFWLNGEYKEDAAAINIADRGFLLGDGIFETLLLVDGVPAFLPEHMARMTAGATALRMAVRPDEAQIGAVITELAKRNGAAGGRASARVTMTRGVGPRGIDFADREAAETMLITVSAFGTSDAPEQVNLFVSQHRRSENTITAHCKTLNYLNNILARDEALAVGAQDAVMLNMAGGVACVSAANLFIICGDTILTPRVADGALPGIVRSVLIENAAREGLQIVEAPISPHELNDASIFITNSLVGLRCAAMMGAMPGGDADEETLNKLKSCYEQAMLRDIDRQRAES